MGRGGDKTVMHASRREQTPRGAPGPGRSRQPVPSLLTSCEEQCGSAGTIASSCPQAATLPGNKCGNLLRKLSLTIYNLRSAADTRGGVKTPCSRHARASGVKIELNGILPLVNIRQAHKPHHELELEQRLAARIPENSEKRNSAGDLLTPGTSPPPAGE